MKMSVSGFISTPAGRVWYGIAGDLPNTTPLIVIHGGPGYPHDYLTPINKLSDKRNVIFYDQAGCGNSDRSVDKKYWTTNYYFSELNTLIKRLKLKEYYLLGQSWGAAIAASHAASRPKGLRGLILSDPYLCSPIWMEDVVMLKKKISAESRKAMDLHEKNGTTASKDYARAAQEYIRKFVKGMDRDAVESKLSGKKMNGEIYDYMWGAQESVVTGTLKNFDLCPKLSKIEVPTLLLCGKNDEATPRALDIYQGLIKNSKKHVFKKSAHIPFLSERAEYLRVLRGFLDGLEA